MVETQGPSSGLITWLPTEAQGPTNAVFVVRAVATSPLNLSSTVNFSMSIHCGSVYLLSHLLSRSELLIMLPSVAR